MPEARGKYPNNNSSEHLADLKAGLLAFRARHMDERLPDIEKPVPGRLGDITHPLLSVAGFLPVEAKTGLLTLIGELETQRKEDQAETLPGQIATALYDLRHDSRIIQTFAPNYFGYAVINELRCSNLFFPRFDN